MTENESLEVIKQMKNTFPNPHLILQNIINEKEYLLLGSNKKEAYISYFELSLKDNGRYYPEYKAFKRDFNKEEGLLAFEDFISKIYDPLKYKIIYDLIYFTSLHT